MRLQRRLQDLHESSSGAVTLYTYLEHTDLKPGTVAHLLIPWEVATGGLQ